MAIEMDVFDMDALVIKGLVSCICIIIRKADCKALTLHRVNRSNQAATKMQT